MTLSEFKAWFDGFTEDMDGEPSAKQWRRIKARVKEIDGATVTQRVYVERYHDYLWPRYAGVIPYGTSTTTLSGSAGQAIGGQAIGNALTQASSYDSHAMMSALGKADYQDALKAA